MHRSVALHCEEGDGEPKPPESQDDGYETSNSGDARRAPPAPVPRASPAPPPPPTAHSPGPLEAPPADELGATAPAPASMAAPDESPPQDDSASEVSGEASNSRSDSSLAGAPPHAFDALDLHRAAPPVPTLPPAPPAHAHHTQHQYAPVPPPQPHYRPSPYAPGPPQPQPAFPPLKRDVYDTHEMDAYSHHYPFPKYGGGGEGLLYGAFGKREPDAPYDMSQHQHQPYVSAKRDDLRDDMLYNGVKRECDDPYSFVEEEAMCAMLGAAQPHPHATHPHAAHLHAPLHPQQLLLGQPKKRGRKKKVKEEEGAGICAKTEGGVEGAPRPVKERKKHDRFNGLSEEEVSRRTLPDHLAENLDIIIIGINPGLFAAYKGHHYAGPGNHFWKCLYLSGLTREQMSADEDYKLLNFGIGFTNMVARPTKGSADLTRREIKEGSAILLEKLQTFRPKVAVFNGKLIYEVFSGKKDFCFGKQPDTVAGTNTYMWVMPSSSARCAQLPRAADKVPFYAALKKFRDYLNGLVAHVDESELVFPDTTGRRPQDELEIRRLTMEPEPGDTIILEDGTEVPLKKKRGRPKKIKLENGEVVPPAPRAPRQPRQPQPPLEPGDQPPKKKRGRPKKIRPEDQQFLLQQQQQQQQQQQHQHQQQTQQAMMTQQLSGMQQQNEPQYTMHQPADFPGAGLGEPMAQGQMMYQSAMPPAQPQNMSGTQAGSPYYQGPQGTPSAALDTNPLDMGAAGVGGGLGPIGRSQSAYAQSPGSYSQSPRPQSMGYVQSPRPQAYGQSPQRHQSVTPSYTSSPAPAPRPAGTPQPAFPQSPAAQQPVPYSQPSPQRPQSQSHAYSSPARHPYSRSPIPQQQNAVTYAQPQQSPMYAQSPAAAPQAYSQLSPASQGGPYAAQSPAPVPHPYSRSPIPQQCVPFPQHSPALGAPQSYTPSPAHTPYSQHSSPAAAGRTPGYAHSPHQPHQFGGPSPLHGGGTPTAAGTGVRGSTGGGGPRGSDYGAELSSDISAAISSPGPVSPGIGHIDFEPPIAANKIRVGSGESLASQENSPMGSTDMHAGSNSNSSLSDFNKAGSGGGELSPAAAAGGYGGALYEGEQRLSYAHPLPLHSPEYREPTAGECVGPGGGAGAPLGPLTPYGVCAGGVAGSPRLDQLQHPHPSLYSSPYARGTPPGNAPGAAGGAAGAPFSPPHAPAFRPPEHAPHTPGSPSDFGGGVKNKSQDVASKSLSGLESLVDQIPSIAEGPANSGGGPPGPPEGGGVGVGAGAAPSAPPPLPEAYAPALYGPYGYGAGAYGNNSYGSPFVGYGAGGWGGQLMRPTPGYLGEPAAWQYAQYGAAAGSYAPANYAPYYNGYAGAAPHQQYLSHASHVLDHLAHHKDAPAHAPGVPAVPSVPSVGFGGFC